MKLLGSGVFARFNPSKDKLFLFARYRDFPCLKRPQRRQIFLTYATRLPFWFELFTKFQDFLLDFLGL
jgi:hypothetical protein